MIGQPRPSGGLRLRSLVVWSLGIGLAWLLLGQQLAGHPVVQLDLTAGLPGASSVHRHPLAPVRSAPAPHQQTSQPSSTQQSTGTSTRSQHSTTTSTPNSQAAARAVAFALAQQGK